MPGADWCACNQYSIRCYARFPRRFRLFKGDGTGPAEEQKLLAAPVVLAESVIDQINPMENHASVVDRGAAMMTNVNAGQSGNFDMIVSPCLSISLFMGAFLTWLSALRTR